MRKTALVTGAASGIGAAIAEFLAKSGYRVVISDLQLDAAESLAQRLKAQGYLAESHRLDVSRQEDIEATANQYPIDILINNAGIQHVAKLEEFPVDRWRLLTDILLVGPAMLTRACLPHMKASGFGRIVNIGSIHALVASPYKSAYVAAKHGLLGFSKVVALETGEYDITINTLCPSYVKTPLVDQQITAQALEHGIPEAQVIHDIMLQPMPKKAFIGLDELTACVNFLISAEARNITGQSLVIDGGWTVR